MSEQEVDIATMPNNDSFGPKEEKNSMVKQEQNEEPSKEHAETKLITFVGEGGSSSDGTTTAAISENIAVHDTKLASEDLIIDVDTRVPYRQGWPLLPVLPVHTSREHVPKAFSEGSTHFQKFHDILFNEFKITVHKLEIAHRFHTRTPIGKATLTLCVQSDASCIEKWEKVIVALRAYIQQEDLNLAIEIIDHRIFNGMYTLPIISYDPITPFMQRRKHGIVKLLNESGEEWTSLEFYYRGLGPTRSECKATVLIGVPKPNRSVWWDVVLPKVKDKVGEKMQVEVCWREVLKV